MDIDSSDSRHQQKKLKSEPYDEKLFTAWATTSYIQLSTQPKSLSCSIPKIFLKLFTIRYLSKFVCLFLSGITDAIVLYLKGKITCNGKIIPSPFSHMGPISEIKKIYSQVRVKHSNINESNLSIFSEVLNQSSDGINNNRNFGFLSLLRYHNNAAADIDKKKFHVGATNVIEILTDPDFHTQYALDPIVNIEIENETKYKAFITLSNGMITTS
jgi:hypothetical protein